MNFNDRSDYLAGLLSALGGIEYYINDFETFGILYYDVGDYYNVQIGENTYKCLMLNREINVTSGLEEIIHTDAPELTETDYTKADKTDRRINQTYIIVDKQNQTIESVVSNVSDQNTKIAQITQTVDDLTAQISDIADITTYGESSYASVQLDDVNESEPVLLKVHPTTTSISYLYPRNDLYPSDTLYMSDRKIRFARTYEEDGVTKTQNIDYTLPDDLLYYDENTYDEFYLDYESQTCQVTKKCGYNADGTVYALATEVVTDYEYPEILLGEGDYTISILNAQYGYIFVRLMAKNIYTTQFYTKVETRSMIQQTASSIDLSVNQKLTNYSTTNEMNSAISLKANEITSSVNQNYATKNKLQEEVNTLNSRITQTAEGITSEVSATYITKTASATNINTAKNEAITSANVSTDGKLTNYYTKTETNTKITQSANSITSSVSATYETKTNASSNYSSLNSRITQNADSISAEVTRATNKEGQLSASIDLKIDKSDNGQIISMINASADRISLTAGRLVITSGNFKLDASGNVTCTNGKFSGTISGTTITGGTISGTTITGTTISSSNLQCYGNQTMTMYGSDNHISTQVNQYGINVYNNSGGLAGKFICVAATVDGVLQYVPGIINRYSQYLVVGEGEVYSNEDIHSQYKMYAQEFVQTSMADMKKDIKKYNENALNKVLNTDVYNFKYKDSNDNVEHIGFIIGDGYKLTPEIHGEKSINIGDAVGMLWKSVQELNNKVEKLEKGA